jgi:hypothetical protein
VLVVDRLCSKYGVRVQIVFTVDSRLASLGVCDTVFRRAVDGGRNNQEVGNPSQEYPQ